MNIKEEIIVRVDADLKPIMARFFELRCEDIDVINKTIEKDDYETIMRIGHSMKGAGGGYGFDYVSEIGAGIESAAKKNDKKGIREWVEKLSIYLEKVEVVYNE